MLKTAVIIMMSVIMFTPAPVIQPGDPFNWDINSCLSLPMKALIIPVGTTYAGSLEVYEPDGESVTVLANKITVDVMPITVKDNADPLGLAVTHTFNWGWTPTADDIGVHYINVEVSDPFGASDARTIVLLIKVNQPPVITGCN